MASNSVALSDPPHIQDEANVDSEMEVKDEQLQALPLEVQEPEDVQLPSEEADISRPSTCQALLGSQIGNNYFQIKQAACVDGLAEPLAGDRCKAMMEVVLKENGRWLISKLVTDHSHSMNTSTHLDACAKVAISSGMVFKSVEAAKDFYYDYSDKLGFKARTGSNRRSAGTGALIMQRYLCCRGSYPLQRYNLEMSAGKRKRGAYNKRGKLLEEVEEKKDGDGENIEVVDIDNLTEIEGLSGEYFESESESRLSVKSSGGGVFGAETESRALVTSTSSTDATTAAAAYDNICGQHPATSVSSQSKILRELGVRVYRYSSDEKRDIILRYLMKKNNRQSGERTIKFFTTQPPPGENFRQQQNAQLHNHISDEQTWGGKFNGRAPLQDRVVARKPNPQLIEITSVVEEPKIGMLFANEDRAYEFYVRYAGNIGFCVRKGWWDKTSRSVTRLRVYVCSKEGYRPKGSANEMKKARPETRTGCPARMAIKLTSNGKYSVSEFVSEHNHDLAVPLDLQMFKSQKLAKVQFGNHYRTRLIPAEYKNYLRSKQIKGMQIGEAGAILEYLQRMKAENTSFFYGIQVDEDDQLTNIFWADANSIMDYDYFGDVICFDTTYKEAECGRPFVQFIGVNHHKQLIFFGAAVLYDETLESFKWLFETFIGAMGGKQPKTILTAKSSIVSDSLSAVWPDTVHRYCVWNIYQRAAKNLCQIFKETETFSSDFSQCIFESFEEEDFLSAWTSLLEKYDLKGNEWLANLYEERKSWALPYVEDIFYADIFNALRREGINSVLKECLSPEIDFIQFLKKYDEYVKVRRYMEREADYLNSQVMSRASPVRLLWQAANVYTHAAFEMFKMEFELLSNCLVYSCGEVGTVSEHEVAVKGKSKLYFVRFDISDSSVFCSCKKFECVGILCCHVLKVLDCRNVKELAPHFFLKRWRKDAKCGLIREDEGFPHQDDPKSFLQQRYSSLCRILYKLAAKAAENVHAYAFMENQSEQILEQVERMLQTKLMEETSMNNTRKDQSQSQIQGERIDNGNNNDSRMLGGRKKRDGTGRRRKQNGMEMNKQFKGLKGKPDAVDISMDASEPPLASIEFHSHVRNSSSQFFPQSQSVQGPYIPGHQFGLGSFQGFHGTPQFTQDFSAPVLQQQPFVGEAHLGQAPEMHALQFVASNSQLGPQGGDQGHYTIPVWDFL